MNVSIEKRPGLRGLIMTHWWFYFQVDVTHGKRWRLGADMVYDEPFTWRADVVPWYGDDQRIPGSFTFTVALLFLHFTLNISRPDA